MPRLPAIDPENLSGKQKQVYENIVNGPRGAVRGPFRALLHCPGAADHVQALGIQLRFDGVLPGRLRELAILVTARFWRAGYEWNAHRPFALEEGLDPAVIEALAEDRTPDFASPDEKTVYDFCRELHEDHRVGDGTYGDAVDALGIEAVVELTMLSGYYTLISMVLKTFEIEPPESA